MNYKNDEGSVSPFLIIVMTALLFLLFALIDIFRINASKNQIHTLGILAINSCMCDYNRELKNDYDLFAFVYQNKFEIEEEIKNNLNKNINGFGINKIKIEDVKIIDYITLENKDEFINQIKKNYIEKESQNLINEIIYNEDEIEFISSEKTNVCTENEYDLISTYVEKDNRDEIKQKIENTNYNDVSLPNELIEETQIEDIEFENSKNESQDILKQIINKTKFVDNFWLNDYILNKFDYLNNDKEFQREKIFDAEIEFIIGGFNSQNKNIQNVKNKILLILYPEKLIEIYEDAEKKKEAELIAQAVCGWWSTEIGVTICKNAILSAWALEAANNDYEKMINNEEIFVKALNKNVTYKDMLSILLLVENEDKKIENIIKLINVNLKRYNYNFSVKTSYSKIKIKIKAKEKFIFMTRKCIPNTLKFTNEIDINEEISYGY